MGDFMLLLDSKVESLSNSNKIPSILRTVEDEGAEARWFLMENLFEKIIERKQQRSTEIVQRKCLGMILLRWREMPNYFQMICSIINNKEAEALYTEMISLIRGEWQRFDATREERDHFFQVLQESPGGMPLTIQPFFSQSLLNVIRRIGYKFTASQKMCHETLTKFGTESITAENVAEVITFMSRVPSGFYDPLTGMNPFVDVIVQEDDNWNITIFIKAVKDLGPVLDYKNVIRKLDNDAFFIDNKCGFANLIMGLNLFVVGKPDYCQWFPIAIMFNIWNNKEGQLSLIKHAIAYPDFLPLDEFPHVKLIKSPAYKRIIKPWNSLELLYTLFTMARDATPQMKNEINQLLAEPKVLCPELLCIGLFKVVEKIDGNRFVETILDDILMHLAIQRTCSPTTWKEELPHINVLHLVSAMERLYLVHKDDCDKLEGLFQLAQELKIVENVLERSSPCSVHLALFHFEEELHLRTWINKRMPGSEAMFRQSFEELVHKLVPERESSKKCQLAASNLFILSEYL